MYMDKLATAQATAETAEAALRVRIKAEVEAVCAACDDIGHPELKPLALSALGDGLSVAQVEATLQVYAAGDKAAAAKTSLDGVWDRWRASAERKAPTTPEADNPTVVVTEAAPASLDSLVDSAYRKWNAAGRKSTPQA
jgi:hypothetical protein